MEFINEMPTYDEYKDKKRNCKISILNSLWRTERSILKGRISLIEHKSDKKKPSYCFINDVKNLYNEPITNPFTEEEIKRVICPFGANFEFEFDNDDEVIFKFDISNSRKSKPEDSEENKPIIAKCSSIKLLKYIEDIIEGSENSDIIEIIKKEYSKKSVVFCKDVKQLIKEEKGNLDTEIEEKKNKLSELDTEIQKKFDELSEILYVTEKEINEQENELSKLKEKRLNEIEKEINERKQIKEEIEVKIKEYEKLGFVIDSNPCNCLENSDARTDITNKLEQIDYIQKYLGVRDENRLYYDREILEMFFMALHTNQIVILCGKPGTGKTSLIEGISDAILAKCKIIPVQSNWTDNQDLLGFYNPIEKAYISTPFLDTIIEANSNPERLYIICLDEMNLAHVEYYFSEFLCKLQTKDKTLELYSSHIEELIKSELHYKIEKYTGKYVKDIKTKDSDTIIGALSTHKDVENDEIYKLIWQWNSFIRYPALFKIPDNVRFVGTINKDETTKDLSPKVVDRSFIIELDKYSENVKKDIQENFENYSQKYSKKLLIKADEFKIKRCEPDREFIEKINNIKDVLQTMGVYLNNRFYDQIKQIMGSKIINDSEKLFDFLVACMVLPQINISVEKYNTDIISKFINLIENMSITKKLFDKMHSHYEKDYILTFWR